MSDHKICPAESPLELSNMPLSEIMSPSELSPSFFAMKTKQRLKNKILASPEIKITVGFRIIGMVYFSGFITNRIPITTKRSEPITIKVNFILLSEISICCSDAIMLI